MIQKYKIKTMFCSCETRLQPLNVDTALHSDSDAFAYIEILFTIHSIIIIIECDSCRYALQAIPKKMVRFELIINWLEFRIESLIVLRALERSSSPVED